MFTVLYETLTIRGVYTDSKSVLRDTKHRKKKKERNVHEIVITIGNAKKKKTFISILQVESVIEFEPGLTYFDNQLNEMKNAQARVYLMYASKQDAEVIFKNAAGRNMTEAGYVWIVTEQALDAVNVPEGTIGLKLVNASNEFAHIYDSM